MGIHGFEITYKSLPDKRRKVSNILFGRLYTKKTNYGKYFRYKPGVFDRLPYCKPLKNKIFVKTRFRPDLDAIVDCLKELKIEEVFDKDIDESKLSTGRERWIEYSKEKDIEISGL